MVQLLPTFALIAPLFCKFLKREKKKNRLFKFNSNNHSHTQTLLRVLHAVEFVCVLGVIVTIRFDLKQAY